MNADHLKSQLKNWKVEVDLPANFQAGVWRQIAAKQSSPFEKLWQDLFDLFLVPFLRPAPALALLSFALFIGVFGGYGVAQTQTRRESQKMAATYVQSINPIQMAQ